METMGERIERQHLERIATEQARPDPKPILDKDSCDVCEICKKRLVQGQPVWRPTPNQSYMDQLGRPRQFWEHVECRVAADRSRVAQADRVAEFQHPDLVVRGLDQRISSLEAKSGKRG